MRASITRLASMASAGDGGGQLLSMIARIASACDFTAGDVVVEIAGNAVVCTIAISSEDEDGRHITLVPPTPMAIPIDVLTCAVELAPTCVSPLRVSAADDRLVLTAARMSGEIEIEVDPEPTRRTTVPVPPDDDTLARIRRGEI